MSARVIPGVATVAQLAEFETVIDARSPAEFADDHIPGAISCPVLSDEERARVGTLYKQVSPFAAKKLGATLVARNIAQHLETLFIDKPKEWRPLVYCWRGGQRSGAFCHILREIGWQAHRLEGGYKLWRRQIIADIDTLAPQLQFRVMAGATGSGKSRLLEALAEQGAQVLHLEALAAHKGSVLGVLPDQSQPSQKAFETRLHGALSQFDTRQPVLVEAESRRIGSVQIPNALLDAMRAAPCLRLEASLNARVEYLLRDYTYFIQQPAWLQERLAQLKGWQSNELLTRWQGLIDAGEFAQLVRELLEQHYDPLYHRSQDKNYRSYGNAAVLVTDDLGPGAIKQLAADLVRKIS